MFLYSNHRKSGNTATEKIKFFMRREKRGQVPFLFNLHYNRVGEADAGAVGAVVKDVALKGVRTDRQRRIINRSGCSGNIQQRRAKYPVIPDVVCQGEGIKRRAALC